MIIYVNIIKYTKISMILLINYKDICILHYCMVYTFFNIQIENIGRLELD